MKSFKNIKIKRGSIEDISPIGKELSADHLRMVVGGDARTTGGGTSPAPKTVSTSVTVLRCKGTDKNGFPTGCSMVTEYIPDTPRHQ